MSDEAEAGVAAKQAAEAAANGGGQPNLKWDDSSMSTSYANVVNVSVTREECGLFFGTNLTTGIGGIGEVTIKLSDRIIMTPHAAKRLASDADRSQEILDGSQEQLGVGLAVVCARGGRDAHDPRRAVPAECRCPIPIAQRLSPLYQAQW